jgi:N-acetylglucosamine kinase-like BadF-type ATPase
VGAGFAGGSDPSDLRALARGLARAFPRAKVGVATDAEIVLLGALGEFPGAVVVAGTGSIALGVSGRRRARSGGWGPLLGDEGSGFALGRSGLTAALRALDGRGRPTRLARSLLRALRARGAMDLLDVVKRGQLPTERIASLAPLVLGEAERGDAVAREIVEREAEELALAAAAVLRRLRLPRGPVAVAGGLFASERFRAAFRRKLRARLPHARMIHSTSPAEEGALALARARLRRAR